MSKPTRKIPDFIPDYRGCTIKRCPIGFEWVHEDTFDASYEGESWKVTGAGYGKTSEECHDAIDDYLAEIDQADRASCLRAIHMARSVCEARYQANSDIVWHDLSIAFHSIHWMLRRLPNDA